MSWILGDYSYSNVGLGCGTYSYVYAGKNVKTGNDVAVKCIKDKGHEYSAMVEINTLVGIGEHPNIISLLASYGCSLVLEKMDRSLFELMSSELETSTIKKYMKQLLNGLMYIHSKGYIHCDIKPENLLVNDSDLLLKIADFGISQHKDRLSTINVQSLWFRAPEILNEVIYQEFDDDDDILGHHPITSAIDMWSVGILFLGFYDPKFLFSVRYVEREGLRDQICALRRIYDLLGGPDQIPIDGPHFKDFSFKSIENAQSPRKSIGDTVPNILKDIHALDLAHGLLNYDPKKRLSAKDALEHPYFQE